MTAHIVLWLDLAEDNALEDEAVQAHIPPDAKVLRLTDLGVPRAPLGTPARWPPVLDVIDRLVRNARKLERQSGRCRYWVTGRAGLPAFFHLGHRLSKIAAVTFVHQARNGGPMAVMPLDEPGGGADSRYFERTPWPVPHSLAASPVALVVSSRRLPSPQQIHDTMAEQRARASEIVQAHSPADLGQATAPIAMRELQQTVEKVCDAHPARSTLAVFIAGPTSLAFLTGAAINPRACRDVQIFQFDGKRYALAYELPYPPVPDRGRVLCFLASPAGMSPLALDEEIRALRLESSADRIADHLDILDVPAARAKDVLEQLRARQPGVVHFSGHGETRELMFQDDAGGQRPVSTEDLAGIFRHAGDSVRLVVLNACHSESHAEAILAHVDCVVAMRGPIWDDDARRFSAAFYRRLAAGDSVRDTFDQALLAMRLERPAVHSGIRRDVDAGESVASAAGAAAEPPRLFERYLDCARDLVLVRPR